MLIWDISPSAADSFFTWSNVVLIVGAAAVLLGTIGSIKFAAIREYFADLRISENERATKEAIAESDKAKAEAAKATLALEKYKSPRSLSPQAMQQLFNAMAAFKGQNVIFGAVPATDEGSRFAKTLAAVVKAAGVNGAANDDFIGKFLGTARGVSIRYTSGNETGKACAEAIGEAFKTDGSLTYAVVGDLMERDARQVPNERNTTRFETVMVVIGDKS
jgi:hypothetical protein